MKKLLLFVALCGAVVPAALAQPADSTTAPFDMEGHKNQLALAIEQNDVEAAKKLLAASNFDVNSTLPVYHSAPALVYAATRKRTAIAKFVLGLPPANPNAVDSYGENAFTFAIQSGNLELVKALSAHPKIQMDSEAISPFFEAVIAGDVAIVKFLMKDPRANYAKRTNQNLNALYLAATHNSSKIIPILLATKRFDVNLPLKYDGTAALHRACDNPRSSTATILALLKAPNIDPNLKDKEGRTPLDRAAATDIRFVQALLTSKKVKVTKANRIQIEKLKKLGGRPQRADAAG